MKDKEKVSDERENILVKVNISQVDFNKLVLTEKKDKAIAIFNFGKFPSYFYSLSIKRHKNK